MILHQRRDALARLRTVNARVLFPLQMPVTARRTAAIAVVAAGFLAYRIGYGPPALTLVHQAAQLHSAEATISPLARAIENIPLNLFEPRPPDVLDEEALANASAKSEKEANLSPPVGLPDGNDSDGMGERNAPVSFPTDSKGDQNASQAQNHAQPDGSSSVESQYQNRGSNGPGQNSLKGPGDGKSSSTNEAQSNGLSPKGGQQSFAQKLEQAIKDLMGNMTGKTAIQPPSNSSPDTQSPPAQGQGNDRAQSAGQGGQQSALNSSQSNETSSNSQAHSGAGSGTRTLTVKQTNQDSTDQNNANLIPERVPLDATDFRVEARPRALAGPGAAELPMTDASPIGIATTNGAEQENIPLRYRQYVQRYFDQRQK